MKKYVAFLRGINVGNIRIKMPDLKVAFEKLGFSDVKTYLQTGNVVFLASESPDTIKSVLEKSLSETFHYDAYVLVYDFEVLTKVVSAYPFEKNEEHHAYIIFVDNDGIFEELIAISQTMNEEIEAGKKVIYWKVKRGDSTDTPFSKILAKTKYKSSTTVRNINTIEKMID